MSATRLSFEQQCIDAVECLCDWAPRRIESALNEVEPDWRKHYTCARAAALSLATSREFRDALIELTE